ncbi:MAG: DsbA family protein [Candidatus Heimdallarchaeota archaeon]
MSHTKLKVIAYSDYICPFCYIGYHRIQQLKKDYNLDVEWKPFEIHPETPKGGALTEDLPFPKGYLEMAFTNVKRLADEDGLELKFSEKLPNSRLALYISEFARKEGRFEEFYKLVLDAYWLEGKDIGDKNLLLDLAKSVGLNKKEIENYLDTDEPFKAVQQSLKEIRKYGINGVPAFIVEDRLIFGAQPYKVFKEVFNNILDEKLKEK